MPESCVLTKVGAVLEQKYTLVESQVVAIEGKGNTSENDVARRRCTLLRQGELELLLLHPQGAACRPDPVKAIKPLRLGSETSFSEHLGL